jgi:alkylation response protein AidB-like acyl-CoA dehydrogenase
LETNQKFTDTSPIKEAVRQFAKQHIKPFVRQWDNEGHFPAHLFQSLGDLGILGVFLPEYLGAAALSYQDYVDVIIELSKIDPSIGLSVAAHNSLAINHIYKFGNERQQRKYLPKLISGEYIGAWALTEPDSGSDAGSLKTNATLNSGKYSINGTKNFITHGKSCDILVLIAKTANNSSAFIIEQGTPGFNAGRVEDKMGMRASETAEVIFTDCIIPMDNLLGIEGEGFKQALSILDGGRISIAALSMGIAEGAYEAALQYAKERVQFGKPIIQHQAIGFKLADMATELHAARLMTYHAAKLMDDGLPLSQESAMAKLYASEIAVSICNEAVQILGGYGFTKDYPVEKFYRDVKLCTIGEGTSEIQKLVIARGL